MSTEGGHSPSHTCVLQQPQTQAWAGVWLLGSAEYGTLREHNPTTNHCVSLFKKSLSCPLARSFQEFTGESPEEKARVSEKPSKGCAIT